MNVEHKNDTILSKLLEAIDESEFRRILDKFHFVQMYKHVEANEDGRHHRHFIGYESKLCRLGFLYELGGGIGVRLGPIPTNAISWESMMWIEIDDVVSFLLEEPIIRWREKTSYSLKENMKMELSMIAKRLEPISDQVLAMFKSEETIAKWKSKLEKYIQDDTRRRYGLA